MPRLWQVIEENRKQNETECPHNSIKNKGDISTIALEEKTKHGSHIKRLKNKHSVRYLKQYWKLEVSGEMASNSVETVFTLEGFETKNQ